MKDIPWKGFFRTIHTLPLIMAPIAVGATWRLLTVPGLPSASFRIISKALVRL